MSALSIDQVLRTKKSSLMVHVGTTFHISTPECELEKAATAVKHGADIIADASIGEQSLDTLKLLCQNIKVPVTCLPGYILATRFGGSDFDINISKEDIINCIEEVAEIGVQGITVHPAFTLDIMQKLEHTDRVFPFTSRMGFFIKKYMKETHNENPFFTYFGDIVETAKKHNLCISIGIATRSPSIVNDGGFDKLFIEEINIASKLIDICRKNAVTVLLEAGGHISLKTLNLWYQYIKKVCNNVPLRVLTLLSDRGMGHDNVTGAISAAYLAELGVEVIGIITRAEHIGMPTLDDIVEALIHYKIALNCVNPDFDLEYAVAKARAQGGCHLKDVVENVIDRDGAKKLVSEHIRQEQSGKEMKDDVCSMCGKSCPLSVL